MRRRHLVLIAALAAVAAGCSSSLAEPASPTPTVEPAASSTGETLPAPSQAGLVVRVPGELDALIAAHASARDELRACIDDHLQTTGGADAQRFPC